MTLRRGSERSAVCLQLIVQAIYTAVEMGDVQCIEVIVRCRSGHVENQEMKAPVLAVGAADFCKSNSHGQDGGKTGERPRTLIWRRCASMLEVKK